MRDFVVFYAWQSDAEQRLNRHLIRFALNLAAEAITKDAAVAVCVRIDADTENELGHVPVTETLLKKIASCDAFVPDLTFVAKTESGKLIPNPNVMLEYGYALRAKTYAALIPVMNTAYGPPEQLPFDMGHLRHPIQYNLPANSKDCTRRPVRKALTETFQQILRAMIAAKPADLQQFKEAKSNGRAAFYFRPGFAIATYGFPEEHSYHFDGTSAIYLRLFPLSSEGQPEVGRAALREVMVHRRSVSPMTRNLGGLSASNEDGVVAFDPGHSGIQALTQGFPTGELWGLNSQIFQFGRLNYLTDKIVTYLSAIGAEVIYTQTLEKYILVATHEFKLKPPFIVEIGASGLKDVYLSAPHPEFHGGGMYGPFREDEFTFRAQLNELSTEAQRALLKVAFDKLYDIAEQRRSSILEDRHIQANDIPPRT